MTTTMEILKNISLILGAVFVLLGIIGGFFSLPLQAKRLRKDLQPHGDKGMAFCIIKREDHGDKTEVTFVVADDLLQFLRGLTKEGNSSSIINIEPIGNYYKVVLVCPLGSQFIKTKRQH